MRVTNKNSPLYKKHAIYFIAFYFEKGDTIIYCLAKMKLYVSAIVEMYRDKVIYIVVKSGKVDVSLKIVQRWRVCALDEYNWAITMFMYCSAVYQVAFTLLG